MPILPEHFHSIFFVIGLLTVAVFAWQKFNEPSFPQEDALPKTVEPLRYLFLKSGYHKARITYVAASLFVYALFVWPGPKIVPYLSIVGVEKFPAEGWALVVALIVAGLLPNTNVKLFVVLEETLRRWIHSWFLVPDGTKRTIGILEDASYNPPPSQLNAVPSPLREELQQHLKLPTTSLRYRWARARMLMESLKQMGMGAVHPLRKAAFDPFGEDFRSLLGKCRLLAPDIGTLGDLTSEKEEKLIGAVEDLLKGIYAYIGWGIRYQADSERAVDDTLKELGFRVPIISARRLFDVVAPMVVLVALITMVFWLMVDGVNRTLGVPDTPGLSDSVVSALTSATAASLMFGFAVYIALKRRAVQIERKVWHQGSPRCLVSIATAAGLITWAAIVVSTVIWELSDTFQSLSAMVRLDGSTMLSAGQDQPDIRAWKFLPIKMATALPWLLAGAITSALLASRLSGDVRRTDKASRMRDALVLAAWLAFAYAAAQLMQTALGNALGAKVTPFGLVPILALEGFACGAVIGFMVPRACRKNIVRPSNPGFARTLRDLVRHAEAALGSKTAAEQWVFTPHNELNGITPAEAVQYKGYATGVPLLADSEATRERDESKTPSPTVIEGGRSSYSDAA